MSKLQSLLRQAEIIKLAKRKAFDWNTLDQHLARKEGEMDRVLRISRRTLSRDLNEIDEVFGISIKFDNKKGLYAINQEESCENNNIQFLEAIDMLQLFQKRGKAPRYIHLEKRAARGTAHFNPIISAIENSKKILVTYGKFWKWETEQRTLKPLALKEFKQRWYLLTLDEKNLFKVFALDRIQEISIMNEMYEVEQEIDFETYFQDVFGIINTLGNPIEEVVLTFSEFKGRYIKSLPLHPSQQILADDGNTLTISLKVKIEYELIAEILSHGDEVKVDAPERLKEMVRGKAGNIAEGKLLK
jgi:predicted DNA-binding transcriptional regulator YafY